MRFIEWKGDTEREHGKHKKENLHSPFHKKNRMKMEEDAGSSINDIKAAEEGQSPTELGGNKQETSLPPQQGRKKRK